MKVAAHADDRAVVLLRDRVVPADVVALLYVAVRVEAGARLLGEHTHLALVLAAELAVAALDVEDRIEGDRSRLNVKPERDHAPDALGLRRLRWRVVEVVGQVDVLLDRR